MRIFIFLLPQLIFSYAPTVVRLFNDSQFPLTGIVQGADGTFLGQMLFQPNEQKEFVYDFNPTNIVAPGAPSLSITPYMVSWKCPSGTIYSYCSQVSPGSLVRAQGCPGYYNCERSKEEMEEEKEVEEEPSNTEESSP